MSRPLHDIYYIPNSERCLDVVDQYGLTRTHLGNVKEDEGLLRLADAVKEELDSWREDFYYEERKRVEAINFLQNVMYHQYLPNNTWRKFYEKVLTYFHDHNELGFKLNITNRKTYLKKRPCIGVVLTDGSLVPYMSYAELSEDFGRYRTDVITRFCRKQEAEKYGKKIDFDYILTLLL